MAQYSELLGRVGRLTHDPRRAGRVKRARESPMGWVYTAPALAIFAVFVIAPTAYTVYISTFNWNVLNTAMSKYVGFANYRALFGSTAPSFLSSAWRSLYFSGAMVIGGTALGLGLALLLQRGGRLLGATRVAMFAP